MPRKRTNKEWESLGRTRFRNPKGATDEDVIDVADTIPKNHTAAKDIPVDSKVKDMQTACPRKFGTAVRRQLKAMHIPFKVSCKTTSFAGLGYGNSVTATIETNRALDYEEISRIVNVVSRSRDLAEDQGGGKAMICLGGPNYPFGGAMRPEDYPVDQSVQFWITASHQISAGQHSPLTRRAESVTWDLIPPDVSAQNESAWVFGYITKKADQLLQSIEEERTAQAAL